MSRALSDPLSKKDNNNGVSVEIPRDWEYTSASKVSVGFSAD